MRELYAVSLEPAEEEPSAVLERLAALLSEWAANPYGDGLSSTELLEGGEHAPAEGVLIRTERIGIADEDAEGYLLEWRFPDAADASLEWRVVAAVGRVGDALPSLTLRIGIQQHEGRFRLGRVSYEFRSPTIVRSVLREFTCLDSEWRLQPEPMRLRANDVPSLVGHLTSTSRRLPVVVLTPSPELGRPLVDDVVLARQLAGIATVTTLTTHLATRGLTDEVGPERSVWNGAARIYWPGFSIDCDPRGHRVWFPERLKAPPIPLADELRRWVGAIAALAIPEHPILGARRRARIAEVSTSDPQVAEWVAALEDMVDEADRDKRRLEAELADRDDLVSSLREQLDAKDKAFADMARAMQPVESEPTSPAYAGPIATVADAMSRFLDEVGADAIVLDQAKESAREFAGYNDPEKLYAALRDVAEASRRYGDNTLGVSFQQFFQSRGWVYKPRNPVAYDRRYKAHYQIEYNGERVTMEPHLAIDVGTTRDQCLRIYWYVDEDERVFVIGHIGYHLPDGTT